MVAAGLVTAHGSFETFCPSRRRSRDHAPRECHRRGPAKLGGQMLVSVSQNEVPDRAVRTRESAAQEEVFSLQLPRNGLPWPANLVPLCQAPPAQAPQGTGSGCQLNSSRSTGADRDRRARERSPELRCSHAAPRTAARSRNGRIAHSVSAIPR